MNKNFSLSQGYSVENLEDIHEAFQIKNDSILANISAENLYNIASKLIKNLLLEPIFFFLEIPDDTAPEDAPMKKIYYLDNCTKPVASAILKRYGELLFSDGLVSFGFGSSKNDDEICFLSYNVLSIYSAEISKYSDILKGENIPLENEIKTIFDVFSSENEGCSFTVEVNSENIFDVIENLTDVGLYYSHSVEDE